MWVMNHQPRLLVDGGFKELPNLDLEAWRVLCSCNNSITRIQSTHGLVYEVENRRTMMLVPVGDFDCGGSNSQKGVI